MNRGDHKNYNQLSNPTLSSIGIGFCILIVFVLSVYTSRTTGRAIGDVSKSQKQHGWLKIVLLASSSNDDGKMQEIFNKTFEFPSKNISSPSGYNIFPILYDMPSILYTTENKL